MGLNTWITEGDLNKALIKVSLPLMLNALIYALYNFIDTLFVSGMGRMELASVALIGPLYNVIIAVSTGISISGTALIGQHVGKKAYERVKDYVMHLLLIALFLGMSILITGFFLSSGIMRLASATDQIIFTGGTYFKVLMLSIPLMFLNSVYIAYRSGYGDTKKVMWLHFLSMGVKIIFNYIMIVLLKKGMVYLAYATLLGHFSISLFIVLDLIRHKTDVKKSFESFHLDTSCFKNIVKVGVPVVIERTSMSFSFVMINGSVLKFGETVLAAYGITNRINSVFFSTVSGLGSGLAAVVSQNIGAGHQKRVRQSFIIGMKWGCIVATVFGITILVFKSNFAYLFARDDAHLYGHVIDAISVYSISIIPWAIFQVVIGVFTGAGQTTNNLIITMARLYLFRLPSILLLSRIAILEEFSVWIAMLLSNILTAVFALILYKMKKHVFLNPDAANG